MVITVMGATGLIGSELVRLLSASGHATRAVGRSPGRITSRPGVAWMLADLRDPLMLESILAGTSRLFLLTDNQPGFGGLQVKIIRLARDLGVEHIVKLSALGASDHSRSWIGREHWQVEQALYDSPEEFCDLREETGRKFQEERRAQGRRMVDDPWMQSGEFVVATDGTIRVAYLYNYCADYPDPRVFTTAGRLLSTAAG